MESTWAINHLSLVIVTVLNGKITRKYIIKLPKRGKKLHETDLQKPKQSKTEKEKENITKTK